MEPFHDIYKKEDPPPYIKRRRRHRHGEASAPAEIPTPGPGAESAPRDEKPLRMETWGATTPQLVHRSQKPRPGELANRLLWMGLAALFVIYVFFLAYSVLRGGRKKAAPQVQQTSRVETPAPPSTNAAAFQIDGKIAAWNRVPDALLNAQSLIDQGQIDRAKEHLERTLESAPHVSRLQIKLAQILVEQKRYDQARDILVDVLEYNPEDTTARLALAGVLDSQALYPEALAVAKWILETDSVSLEAHEIAANAYLNTGRKELAAPHLRKIMALERNNPIAQNKLAVMFTRMGEYAKAIQLFNEVLSKNTIDSKTYFNLAVCYAQMSDTGHAVETLIHAMSLFGEEFVGSWLQSPEFDPIRNEPLFTAMQKTGSRPALSNAPGENPSMETNQAN